MSQGGSATPAGAGDSTVCRALELAAAELCRRTHASRCWVSAVCEQQAEVLAAYVRTGVVARPPGTRWAITDVLPAVQALATRQHVSLSAADDPRMSAAQRSSWYGADGRARVAVVPLLSHGETVGLVELAGGYPRDFTSRPDGLDTLLLLVVGLVEQRSRVDAAERRAADLALTRDADVESRSREAELLNRMAAITTASLDTGDVATATVQTVAGLVPFDEVCVVVDGVGEWRVVYSSLPDVDALARAMDGLGAPGFAERLYTERVTVVDLTHEPILGDVAGPSRGLREALVVGLWFDDRLCGAFVLASRSADAFSAADRRLLARLGPQLALAFRSAFLDETATATHAGHLEALVSAMSARDPHAVGHAARVAGYILLLGRELGWHEERLSGIVEAAFLHDVGRIGVADDVLSKPGRLTGGEMDELRRHPTVGAAIIQPLLGEDLARAVRHHHERWDGTGYPDGLAGGQIPEVARALCLADAYDAMSSWRPHHAAFTYEECAAELERCAGRQFDPNCVVAFLRVLERLAAHRVEARAAAAAAAPRLDVATLRRIAQGGARDDPGLAQAVRVLRAERDAHPPVRFLAALVPAHEGWITIADPEEDPGLGTPPSRRAGGVGMPGDIKRDDRANALTLAESGLWVTSCVDLRDEHDELCGLVCSGVAPAEDWPPDLGLRLAAGGGLASAVAAAAAGFSQAPVDTVTDGLTGLYGRRYFEQRLGEEVARATEQGRPLSLLLCDLDRIEELNGSFGRGARDGALRAVADVLLGSVRNVDLAARYGDGRFALALVDTTARRAAEIAERLRAAVAGLDLAVPEGHLTLSIGVAACPRDAALAEELLDKAGWALNLARRRGRDRVVVFAPGEQGSWGPSPDDPARPDDPA